MTNKWYVEYMRGENHTHKIFDTHRQAVKFVYTLLGDGHKLVDIRELKEFRNK